MKILLVDDEKDLIMTLSIILKRWGHEVLSASDGVEAQKVLENSVVDVVISDLIMPNMDGGELLTWLNTQKNRPHFIIMSAYYNDVFVKYFSDKGITNILGKPIQFDKLQAMLKNISERNVQGNDSTSAAAPSVELKEKKSNPAYEKVVKSISQRIPDVTSVAVASISTGTVFSASPENSEVSSRLSQNIIPFFSSLKTLWSSLNGDTHVPKEILFSDGAKHLIYCNVLTPETLIHVDAPIQMTHGLLRMTIDSVLKETSLPTS